MRKSAFAAVLILVSACGAAPVEWPWFPEQASDVVGSYAYQAMLAAAQRVCLQRISDVNAIWGVR